MSDAPYGVIFSKNKVIVGVPHGRKIPLATDIERHIRSIGDTYGYWYEGNGGDKESFPAKYRGSWDTEMAKDIDGFPPEFASAMFGNANMDRQIRMVTDLGKTIFESLLNHGSKLSPLEGRQFTKDTLTTYLTNISDSSTDFLSMAKRIATKGYTEKFFRAGVAKTFPTNWTEFPYKAGKEMKKVIDRRDKFVLDQDRGAYFIGAGHLLNMKKLDSSLEIIGGEKAQ